MRPSTLARLLVALVAVALCGEVRGQTTFTFTNLSSTWGSTTTNNWGAGTGVKPGSSSLTANNDIARIANTGTVNLNLNFGGSGNGVGTPYYLGALDFNPGSGTNTWTLGSNAGTAGTLVLNSSTVNGIADVYLWNRGVSGTTWTLAPTNGGSGAMTIRLTADAGQIVVNSGNTTTIAAVLSGTGGFNKTGVGQLTLSAANTYTGSTTISSGILRLASGSNRLPTGTVVSLGQAASTNVATFDLNGQNQTVAGLNSVAGTNANVNDNNIVTSTPAATLTISGSGSYLYGNGTTQNSGTITGAVNITKAGTGTQTFGSNVGYTGITTVSGGTLVFNGVKSGVGDNIVNGGTLAGVGTVTGNTTVNAGGTIRGDSGTGTGTLNLGNSLTINGAASNGGAVASQLAVNGSGTITGNSKLFVGASTTTFDPTAGKFVIRLLNDGGLTYNSPYSITLANSNTTGNFRRGTTVLNTGDSFAAADFEVVGSWAGYTGTALKITADGSGGQNLVLDFAPVPEPATVLAVAAAGLGLAGWVRRKRKAAATA